MNRNLMIKLIALVMFAAALLGCGGPGNETIVAPQIDAEVPDHADAQPQPDVDAGQTDADSAPEASNDADACSDKKGDPCVMPGQPATCGNLICNCEGKLVVDDGTVMAPCLEDGGPKDAEAGVDAETGVETGTDADAAEADVQVESDADAQAEAEVGQDAEAGVDAETGVETGTDADAGVIDVIPPQEICGNGIDDDNNNLTDCQDPTCNGYVSCQSEICNGADDNGNGLIDETFECAKGSVVQCTLPNAKKGQSACQSNCLLGSCVVTAEICDDNYDNDGDNKVDCADPTCVSFPACQCVSGVYMGDPCTVIGMYDCSHTRRCTCALVWGDPSNPGGYYCLQAEICTDNVDNDGDGKIDCKDPDCTGNSACPEICYDHVDNNGDGKVDCEDPQCVGTASCNELCDGIDNNGINGIDETFECPLGSLDPTCTTSCGTQGQRTCGTGCHWGTCNPPLHETACNDTKDDDCDGLVDCYDPDCWGTATCAHDFGTCSAFTPTGVPYTCGTWTAESVPTEVWRVFGCCANSENDQWCLGGTYNDLSLIHKTDVWNLVSLPVAGSPNGDIVCLGSDQVYMTYNQKNTNDGVFARWNGTSVVKLDNGALSNRWVRFMVGFSASDIRFVVYDQPQMTNARLFRWNGSAFDTLPLPTFPPFKMLASGLWGMSSQDMYLVGQLQDGSNPSQGFMLHFDGTGWARIQTPVNVRSFGRIHGSSSCDVMAIGYADAQSLTLQRNGNVWITKTYNDNGDTASSVTKVAPFKYLLFGGRDLYPGTEGRVATDNGDFTVTWSSPVADPLEFSGGNVSWHVPGTSTMKIAGEGTGGAHILHANCN
ncbi:MAG: hypothetical protein WC750_02165 [Patescibacteria group bacterium]